VCNTTELVAVEQVAVAEATATAAARTVANITSGCVSSGRSSFMVNGRTFAVASATAFATAFASAAAESSACGKCEVAAEFIGETFSNIFIEAVAEAEVNLEKLDPDADPDQIENSLVTDIQEVTIVAFADVRLPLRRTHLVACIQYVPSLRVCRNLHRPGSDSGSQPGTTCPMTPVSSTP